MSRHTYLRELSGKESKCQDAGAAKRVYNTSLDNFLADDPNKLPNERRKSSVSVCAHVSEVLAGNNGSDKCKKENYGDDSEDIQIEFEELTMVNTKCFASKEEKVGLSHFQPIRLLGSGTFGRVFLVQKRGGVDHLTLYAMKVLEKYSVLQTMKDAEHTKAERIILETIQQSPFLVSLHYAFQTDCKLCLVMDYAIGGDLFTLLISEQHFPEATVRICIAELVVALEHLHKLGIIYRDVKPENILIDGDGHIMLIDFGLAKILKVNSDKRAYSFCGTPEYIAPEVINPGPNGHDFAIDWWAVGVLTFELLRGMTPIKVFNAQNLGMTTFRRTNEIESIMPSSFSKTVKDFILKMLHKDPEKRLGGRSESAAEIKNHPFFNEINWNELKEKNLEAPFKPPIKLEYDPRISNHEFALQQLIGMPTAEGRVRADRCFRGFSYVAPQHCKQKCQQQVNHNVEYCNEPVKDPPLLPTALKLGNLVGTGSFGCCYVISDRGKEKNRVAKVIPEYLYHATEVDAMIACGMEGHKHICNYINTYRNDTVIWIVMEYLSGGDLQKLVQTTGGLSESQCCDIFCQVCDAVQYMHSKNFIHGDLKPENILFTDKQMKHIKLVDFGAACWKKDCVSWQDVPRYTLDYAPPEVLEDPQWATYSKAFDIWCIGATLFTMYMGHPPFRNSRTECVIDSVIVRRILDMDLQTDSTRWNNASSNIKHLILENCLIKVPEERAPIEEIMAHVFLCLKKGQQQSPGNMRGSCTVLVNVWHCLKNVAGKVVPMITNCKGRKH